FEPRADGRTLCRPGARHWGERHYLLGGETVLRLWARQRADLSDGGRRHQRLDGGTADSWGGRPNPAPASSDDLLRGAHTLQCDARQQRFAAPGGARVAVLRFGW